MMTNNPIESDLLFPAEPLSGSDKVDPPMPALAGFFPRMMAFLIDLAVLAVLHCGFFMLLWLLMFKFFPVAPASFFKAIATYFILFCLTPLPAAMIYFVMLPAGTGLTLGKMMMGLRIVSCSGGEFTHGLAFLRFTGYLLSALPAGAGFYWVLVDREHLCWHDRLATTMVIDEYFA